MYFKWIGGATWILKIDNVKIACDPVLCPKGTIQDYRVFKSKRIAAPIFSESDFENIDLWLLTHNHEDHLDKPGQEKIKKSIVIGDRSVQKRFDYKIDVLDWHHEKQLIIKDVKITMKAIPAYHARKRLFSYLIGNGNGYLLKIQAQNKTKTIYVTGDGVFHPGMSKYFNDEIDLVIVNAGLANLGPGTLSKIIGGITNGADDVLRLKKELKPKMIIPVHWGAFSHYAETMTRERFFEDRDITIINPGSEIEI